MMKTKFVVSIIIVLLIFAIGPDAMTTKEVEPGRRLLAQEPRRIEYAGQIGYGDRITGELSFEIAAHLWEFEGSEGDEITIAMNALDDELDPYLLLLFLNDEELDFFLSLSDAEVGSLSEVAEEFGVLLADNDDRDEDTNSLIGSFILPANGRYFIVATSCCTGDSPGEYELILERTGGIDGAVPEEQFPDDDTPFIPQTTRSIDPDLSARFLVETAGDGATILFSEDIYTVIRPFNENDVLAIAPTEQAPDGLLRRVVGVGFQPGLIELTTVQASLEEAIYNGTVQARIVLTPDGGFVAQGRPGSVLSRRSPQTAGNTFTIPFLDKEITPGVTASGTIELEPSFDLEMVIEHFKLKRLIIKNTTRQQGELSLTTTAAYSKNAEVEVMPLGDFDSIGVNVRGTNFTIWLTPELTLYLGISGSAEAAVTVTVNQEVTYDVGLVYENDQLSLTAQSSGQKIQVDDPTVTSEADAKAYLKPELAMVVFGGTGPYIAAEGYLRFAADPCESPWWELVGGVSGLVGARVSIFSFDLLDEEWPIVTREWPLDSATGPAPLPCLNGGNSGNGNGSGNGGGSGGLILAVFVVLVLWYFFRRRQE